ncbi:DNA-binding response regulator [Pedobacter psychrophilus]|uniref:DNA-binding response regulator n=1 Tax=Pedobacter psychrophilus TaxID=1826909 RepID=A0A179DLC2_9SPHI|nr:response regulator transcription factor [Pedobacter psychrophilus]OAQ41811.1 DNA-binding response regulator [Pedobacter psychrophilus]
MFDKNIKLPVNIAIAEDNSFALKACLDKLAPHAEFKVVMNAFNGEELLQNINKKPVDLILMDIQMPSMNGIDATRLVKQNHPHLKILMLTTFDDDENIFKAIMAGANGYLLKEENSDNLRQSIFETLSGGAAMSAGVALRVLNLLRNPPSQHQSNVQDYGLTKREIELLTQLKNGLSYEQIATNLYISYGTVRKHIENIYRKLQVNNKVNAIDVATKNRLI